MEKETIKTITIIAFAVILLGGAIGYFSFNAGQNSKLKELADNNEFPVNFQVDNETTELRTFRLQDYFVTIEAYNKLNTDCQTYINQLTGN